jgi:hypothetical protein
MWENREISNIPRIQSMEEATRETKKVRANSLSSLIQRLVVDT